MNLKNKRALVVGAGKSGLAAVRYLCQQGAQVTLTDKKSEGELDVSLQKLKDLTFVRSLGGHDPQLFADKELLVLSPGINPNTPEVQLAKSKGVEIVNEPELAFRGINQPIIAITGSNGKTTTTTLIGEILKADGRSPFVGGNIGNPLLNLLISGVVTDNRANEGNLDQHPTESAKESLHKSNKIPDIVVAELSSYQLELIESLKPKVAVVTNISQNHLDRYKEMKNYVAAKKRLRQLCTNESFVVLNADDPELQSFYEGSSKAVFGFSSRKSVEKGCYYERAADRIVFRFNETFVLDVSSIRIPGVHNIENLMAATCATIPLGVKPSAIQKVINEFGGVPHRIEFVREFHGVRFFNDSKSTTVGSLIICLASFQESNTILLLGGRDKGSDYRPLLSVLDSSCREVIVFGEARDIISEQLKPLTRAKLHVEADFEKAVRLAGRLAAKGDNVVLSPACASQDAFRDFEHRGDTFKKIVNSMV